MPLVTALGLWCGNKLTVANKKGLSVLALVTDAFGSHGGIAQYNQDLLSALALSSRVSDILVVPRHGARPKGSLPERVGQTPPRSGRISYAAHALAQALFGTSFDVVFCGHLYMSPLATLISETFKKPMWLQLHGIEAWERPGRLVRTTAERATIVTAVSRHTRHRFLEWANLAPERVKVLPNTYRPEFAPGPKRDDLAEHYKLRGSRVLLTVSRLAASERYKGHDRVISLLPKVLERNPDVAYLVVGDGDDRQRLEEMAQATGVAHAIKFAGHVSHRELLDYFRLADVFVMPSTGEGFGIAFLEAAASGLRVIGGNRDGSVDALAEGTIGTLVDPDDAPQLVGAICNAFDRGARRTQPAAVVRFGLQNFNSHVDDLIRSLR
jgi:phosphatidylinositol alpha-1,6-mannosyltransferase